MADYESEYETVEYGPAYHAPIHHRALTETPTEHALSAHHQLPAHSAPVEQRPIHVSGISEAQSFATAPTLTEIGPLPSLAPLAPQGRHLTGNGVVASPYAPPPNHVHPRPAQHFNAAQQLAPVQTVRRTHWGAVITAALLSGLLASVGTAAWITLHPTTATHGTPGGLFSPAPTYPGSGNNQPTAPVAPGPVENSTATSPYWQGVTAAVSDSVVAIQASANGSGSVGSGFIIDEQGHVLTNNHVIAGADNNQVQVTLADGRLHHATIVGGDAFTDLAVLLLQNPPNDLRPVSMGDSDVLFVGDPVLAIGNPLGLANTSTTGIISAINRPVTATGQDGGQETVTNAIQIDAAINPGNSGGPLFDHQGRVIGVTSSIASLSSGMFGGTSGSIGLGFAIPINLARNISAQLIAHGEAQHPRLGVSLRPATATVDGVSRRGARIEQVFPGTGASDAGLEVGDVVIAMNGLPVSGSDSLTGFVRERSVGDEIALTVIRDGQLLNLTATLGAMTDVPTPAVPEPELTVPPLEQPSEGDDGAEVEEESWLDEYGYEYGVENAPPAESGD